jgi:hypothetical protein
MTNSPQIDHAGTGGSLGGSQRGSSSSDRGVGSTTSSDGSAVTGRTLSTDEAGPSTLREEVANLKDVLSKYISGRRERGRANGP